MVINNLTPINQAIAKALDATTEKVLDELELIIQDEIYDRPETWGGRSGEFGKSWEKSEVTVNLIRNVVEAKIFQNEDIMNWTEGSFDHGNMYVSARDWASTHGYNPDGFLAGILNYGTSNAGFGFKPAESTHFWEKFINYVNKYVPDIFATECSKLGLTVVPIGIGK